ncbi:transposase family protein [Amycolatopsis sp. FBCC-B4732]|uniref:transposase family protein n=1 Tax=Amycolatopsis sp. FBCC-B4732 TaxID=3079339 RepID=UPI0037C10872
MSGALTAAAGRGLTTLADEACHSAGVGVLTPVKKTAGQPPLASDNPAYNLLHARLRCLGERAKAMLKTWWRTLTRITLCRHRIGAITQATLVLTHHEHQHRY